MEEKEVSWKHRTTSSLVSISRKDLLKHCKEQLQKEDQILHWLQNQHDQILQQKPHTSSSQDKKRSMSPNLQQLNAEDDEELLFSQDLCPISPIAKRRKLNETDSSSPLPQHLLHDDNSI